jgi:hypothetical protein
MTLKKAKRSSLKKVNGDWPPRRTVHTLVPWDMLPTDWDSEEEIRRAAERIHAALTETLTE